MTAHELGRFLLAGDDVPVAVDYLQTLRPFRVLTARLDPDAGYREWPVRSARLWTHGRGPVVLLSPERPGPEGES